MTSIRIVNPYRDDPTYGAVRERYGAIQIGPEICYRCEECGASWVGEYGDDECFYCANQWTLIVSDHVRKLLLPEFLEWGETYWNLSPIDKEVWQRTRGYGREFEVRWLTSIDTALEAESITKRQALQAIERYDKWIANPKMPPPSSDESPIGSMGR